MDESTPTSVYLYRDNGGLLIYVGITSKTTLRNVQHNKTKEWWKYVSSQEVEHYPTRKLALERETRLITQYSPPFNVQQNAHHAEMKAAYVLYRTVAKEVESPEVLFCRTAGSIPLHRFSISNGISVLRCNPEHASLVCILQMPKLGKPHVFLNGQKVGAVQDVKQSGAFVWIRISARKWVTIDNGAILQVKRVNCLKPQLGFKLSRIIVNELQAPIDTLLKEKSERRLEKYHRKIARRADRTDKLPATEWEVL